MKNYLSLVLIFVFSLSLSAQNYNPTIDSLINKVNEDSLVSFVRILSGEDSVYIDGVKSLIEQRVYNSNDLAANYLFETLTKYNLSPTLENYSTDGTNVISVKEGNKYPDEYFMICAHYDGVTYHAADDNASGSATVLEAARILADVDLPYSVIFALWDEEEIGLYGSKFYAQDAAMKQMDIRGVINIDMIGWDSDDDGRVEIHSKDVGNSQAIANVMVKVNDLYGMQLDPIIQIPGTGASDHSSFWNNGFGALLLIEGYWSGDFNPYYHQSTDRIEHFNVPYFHSAAQLAFGTFATLAYPNQFVGIGDFTAFEKGFEINCYPNPAKNKTTVNYSLPDKDFVNITLVNILGQRHVLVENKLTAKGEHNFEIETSYLTEGIYTILISTRNTQSNKSLVVIK